MASGLKDKVVLIARFLGGLLAVFVSIHVLLFVYSYFSGFKLVASFGFSVLIYFLVVANVFVLKRVDCVIDFVFKKLLRHRIERDIALLNDKVAAVIDLNELSNTVVNTLAEVFNLKSVSFLVLCDDGDNYYSSSSYGVKIKELSTLLLSSQDVIVKTAYKLGSFLYRSLLNRALTWQEATAASHSFARLRAHYIFPVFHDHKIYGFLCINSKSNNDRLSNYDIKQLKKFSKIISIPLINARKYSLLSKKVDNLVNSQSHMFQNAKMFALEQLASGIAHEIHNPLTIISGKAQVMLLKGTKRFDYERVRDVLDSIVNQTKRAAEITRRLLMFSKPQHTAANRLINIENVINDTISLVSYQVSLDEISIVKVIDSNIPVFEASLFEIRELFLNLLLNAIQAIGKKGVITFTVQFLSTDKAIKFSISDTGSGMKKDVIPRIFDPFYSLSQERVGLGLFVCQQIVNRLGGSIQVESDKGVGTVFLVFIPVQDKQLLRDSSDKGGADSTDVSFFCNDENSGNSELEIKSCKKH